MNGTNMRIFEFNNTNVRENLTCFQASLIKAVNDGDREVAVFLPLCFIKENYEWIMRELRTKLKGLCSVKSSRPRNFCGFKTCGVEVDFLSDDRDILRSRILDLFKDGCPSAEMVGFQIPK